MKKLIFISGLVLLLGLAPHALAQGFVPIAPITNLTTGDVASQEGLANFFNNLYKYLIGLAAILAIIEIVWGGLEIAVNKESPSKITDSKGRIYNAIFGLLLVLAPALVFGIINPSILNLGINLSPLPTKPTTPSQGGVLGGGFGNRGPAPASCPSGQSVCAKTNTCLTTEACRGLDCSPDGKTCCDKGAKFCSYTGFQGCILPTATCVAPPGPVQNNCSAGQYACSVNNANSGACNCPSSSAKVCISGKLTCIED